MIIRDLATPVLDDRGWHDARELARRAAAARSALQRNGARRGRHVALVADNGAAFVTGLLGIAAADAVPVLVDPALPPEAVARVVGANAISQVCVAGDRARRAAAGIDLDAVSTTADPTCETTIGPIVFASSGTTGTPKSIVLSHAAIAHNVAAIAAYLEVTSADTFYIAKSMVHSSTLVGEVLVALHAGARIIALDPVVTGAQFVQRIERHRPTIVCVNPSLLRLFCTRAATRDRLASVRILHVSGAVVDSATFLEVHERFPRIQMFNAYGLTEAGPRVSRASTARGWKPGSVGTPIAGVAVCVRDRDGNPCATDEIGEICVATPSKLAGYLDRDGALVPVAAGELRTGDRGRMDRDGELFVIGRADDLIITAAHNVDPHDVEAVIRKVPGVVDCLVFGIPDRLLGERVICAYVGTPVIDRLRHSCDALLAPYQIPRQFCRWDELPRTTTGKPSRASARALFATGVPQ